MGSACQWGKETHAGVTRRRGEGPTGGDAACARGAERAEVGRTREREERAANGPGSGCGGKTEQLGPRGGGLGQLG